MAENVGKRWRREVEVLTHDVIGLVAYPEIAGLVEASRNSRTLHEHIDVQKALARANLDARNLDRTLKEQLRVQHDDLRAQKAAGDMKRVHELSRIIADHKLTLDANQRRRYALRVVQDGVIWRLSGFNRHAVAILGFGTPINYPSASFRGASRRGALVGGTTGGVLRSL